MSRMQMGKPRRLSLADFSSEIIFDATEQAGVRALVSVGWVCKIPVV